MLFLPSVVVGLRVGHSRTLAPWTPLRLAFLVVIYDLLSPVEVNVVRDQALLSSVSDDQPKMGHDQVTQFDHGTI